MISEQIWHFGLHDAPECFLRPVIDTARHSGHRLLHGMVGKHFPECRTRVLKSSVAVEQRGRIRVRCHSLIECIEYKRIVIAVTYCPGNDGSVIKVHKRTEIDLSFSSRNLELCDIRCPFLIRCRCLKIPLMDLKCL